MPSTTSNRGICAHLPDLVERVEVVLAVDAPDDLVAVGRRVDDSRRRQPRCTMAGGGGGGGGSVQLKSEMPTHTQPLPHTVDDRALVKLSTEVGPHPGMGGVGDWGGVGWGRATQGCSAFRDSACR